MRSLYIAILAVMFAVLSLSYLVFRSISVQIEKTYFDPVFERIDLLEIESARGALESGGDAALAAYLRKLDRIFGGTHFLTNERGVDIVSGADLSSRIPHPPAVNSRFQLQNEMIVTHRSEDGHLWLIALAPVDRSGPLLFSYYYILIAMVMIVLFWLASVGLVNPIRKVSKTADQFGRGEFGVRVDLEREDELGSLAHSFNQMADRIETLITSQRRLMQDISHELRSPLARLKLATKLAHTSHNQQAALDRIDKDLDRMTVLIRDLLDIARMEGDSSLTGVEVIDIGALTQTIVSDCSIEADRRLCRLILTGTTHSEVKGNRELLRRAIENVIRNAIRYSPLREAIDIHLAEGAGLVSVEIRDRGPGVEELLLTSIFDPFFRTDSARDLPSGGAGLGLAIAKRAVELHRGAISALNCAPGLRVTMTVPIAEKL